jgi:hypothetical protein
MAERVGADKGYLTKLRGPAVSEAESGPVDVVLVSHHLHPDNPAARRPGR